MAVALPLITVLRPLMHPLALEGAAATVGASAVLMPMATLMAQGVGMVVTDAMTMMTGRHTAEAEIPAEATENQSDRVTIEIEAPGLTNTIANDPTTAVGTKTLVKYEGISI